MDVYNPQEIEKKILRFWERNKLFEKSMKLRKRNKTFSFMDGPPTANNPMGVHHSWGRTYKDLYLRLKTMQGFDNRKQPGFDCQGLWVEVGVEKELGFKTKKDIEKFGIERFTNRCKDNVLNYVKVWVDLSKKLGMWMNWENPYLTMSDTNIEYVWYFLKKCHRKGWLYKGLKVLPWCSRCGTSLSSHEVAVGYKEKTHPAIFVKFPIKDRENEFLLIYTTTPWTLISNVAVAAHPDAEYLKVKVDDEILILAKDLVDTLIEDKDYGSLGIIYGRELVELQYENPMKDSLPIQWNITGKVVLSDKYVNLEEGTGLVHIAPGHGPEDYEIGEEYKLPVLSPIDESGIFDETAGFASGKTAKEASELVLEKLRERGLLYKESTLTHSYPCCWRCDEELIYRTGKEWFISSEQIKPRLLREAKKVKWYPEWAQKSMLDWLKNLKDWNISRKRYFGLPLPFWQCDNGHIEVIGSKKELKKKSIKGFKELKELHRPWIDNVILKCPKCKKEMRRVPETGDCWLDAGVVFFSTLKYLEDKKHWKKWFPADFITEMHEQVRLWFYATLFTSVTLENRTPYKSVLAHAMVLDENYKEMHASAGNAIWADEALEKMGGDVMRWMYCKQNPGYPLPFGYTPAKEVKRILNILFNTTKFLKTYCDVNKFKKTRPRDFDKSSKWILSRLQTVKLNVTKYLEELKPHLASKELEDFFLYDLSRWYGHIIREDIKPGLKRKYKKTMLYTFYVVMLDTLKLLSPFIPFLTEFLYQDFFKKFERKESIHLCDWPKVEKKLLDKKLERQMEIAKKVVEASNAIRHEKGFKLKYALQSLTVSGEKEVLSSVKKLKAVIERLASVEAVKIGVLKIGKEFDGGKLVLDTKPTPKLKEKWKVSECIRGVQKHRKELKLSISQTGRTLHLPKDRVLEENVSFIAHATGTAPVFEDKVIKPTSAFEFEKKKYPFKIDK